VAFDRWHEWALGQRDFIIDGKPGIAQDEYEAVARRFASLGIMSSADGAPADRIVARRRMRQYSRSTWWRIT